MECEGLWKLVNSWIIALKILFQSELKGMSFFCFQISGVCLIDYVRFLLQSNHLRLTSALEALDFDEFARITMADSNQMHAICLDTFPPLRVGVVLYICLYSAQIPFLDWADVNSET